MGRPASEAEKALVVVLDDDEAARVSLGQMLRLRGYRTELLASAEAALRWAGLDGADCMLSDVKMPGIDGEAFLAEVVDRGLIAPVVMITGHGDVPMAVRCLKAGAYDFIEKPFDEEVLLACVGRAVEKAALRRESSRLRAQLDDLCAVPQRHGMVGESPAMRDLHAQIEAAARTEAPVLIRGETGAGKELAARAIHAAGARAGGPLVAVNAGALSETLLDSELFGHTRGAFTGAHEARAGKLARASGGCLLLDEVECLTEAAQLRLLRVLEDGQLEALGSDRARPIDVRLLCTSKQDLQQLVQQGRMRQDFYHRVVVLTVFVPPLRQRRADIPALLSHFVRHAASRDRLPVPRIPEQTLAAMMRHDWPGNVRELRNAAQRLVATARDGVAGPFLRDAEPEGDRLLSLPNTSGVLRDALERTEREAIQRTLRRHRGEVGHTAESLGISRRALYERMRRYDLNKEDFRGPD